MQFNMSAPSKHISLAKRMLFALVAIISCLTADQVFAQVVNTTIQLPTVRVTQFSSSFSVPDGGTINLGRIPSGESFSRGRRSFPRSRSITPRGTQTGAARAGAHVLIMKELELKMLDNTRPRVIQMNFDHRQLNGDAQTQAQADFISGNINRR